MSANFPRQFPGHLSISPSGEIHVVPEESPANRSLWSLFRSTIHSWINPFVSQSSPPRESATFRSSPSLTDEAWQKMARDAIAQITRGHPALRHANRELRDRHPSPRASGDETIRAAVRRLNNGQ